MIVKYERPMAMAAPRSSSGTVGSLLAPNQTLSPPQQDAPGDLVGDDHGEDQQPLEDDHDLPGKVGADRQAILTPGQDPEQDGGQNDPSGVIPPEERHGDTGETQQGLVVDAQEARVNQEMVQTDEPCEGA